MPQPQLQNPWEAPFSESPVDRFSKGTSNTAWSPKKQACRSISRGLGFGGQVKDILPVLDVLIVFVSGQLTSSSGFPNPTG